MNIVIISGKVISEINFKFIYYKDKQGKHTSIASCKLQVDKNTIVDIYGYDENADALYRSYLKTIWCEGSIENNMKVRILSMTNNYLN